MICGSCVDLCFPYIYFELDVSWKRAKIVDLWRHNAAKITFFEKRFWANFRKKFQHDRLCHFFQFLGYKGQNFQKQPFWVLFPYSPLYKCLDRRFFTFAVFFPNSSWYPETFRPKSRADPPPRFHCLENLYVPGIINCTSSNHWEPE